MVLPIQERKRKTVGASCGFRYRALTGSRVFRAISWPVFGLGTSIKHTPKCYLCSWFLAYMDSTSADVDPLPSLSRHVVAQGAIHVQRSILEIAGNSTFLSNVAGIDGGEPVEPL